MKHIALATLLFALPALGEPVVSPEVQPDGRVTFRLLAPMAKQVQADCDIVSKSAMTRGTNGVWTFTTKPLDPDFYAYSFLVDSVQITDPNNPLLKYNLLNSQSLVHVPGPKSLLWELNDVPHGVLHRHYYHSSVSDDDRDFVVYTPPDYRPATRKLYPVLYLLHGFSDDATGWTSAGRANVILDNLIARGQAKPMIVVMPLGYGTMDYLKTTEAQRRTPAVSRQNADQFGEGLFREVVPQVEAAYRVSKKPQMRAIAGLSMGGWEALRVGLGHTDQFGWIGSFSAGGPTNFIPEFSTLDRKVNARVKLLWIGCGKEDKFFAGNKDFSDWLDSQGVRHTWMASTGAHNFLLWRRYLGEFVPLLFQDKE